MYLSDTMPTLLLVKNTTKQYNTLNTNDLGGGIAQQIIHSIYLYKTCSDAFAKCLIVLLK